MNIKFIIFMRLFIGILISILLWEMITARLRVPPLAILILAIIVLIVDHVFVNRKSS